MKEDHQIITVIESNKIILFKELFTNLKNKKQTYEYGKFSNWSLLHIAAENGQSEIIESIFQIEPDFPVDIQDRDCRTPLQRAILKEDMESVRLLLEKGANPNANMGSLNPIMVSALHKDLKIFDFIISKGGDINFTNSEGNLFFYISRIETKEQDAYERAKFLISKGLDVNHCAKKDSMRPIYLPIEMGNLNVVKLYVENGADLHVKDDNGDSPLVFALKKNQEEIAEYLMSQGAKVSALDIMNNIKIDIGYRTDEEVDEDVEEESFSYQLIFHDVDENQRNNLQEDFEDYTWGLAFDVISYDSEYESTTKVLKINFSSRKYFIYEEPTDSIFSDQEKPNLKPLEKNIYYRLIGKEQYLSKLSYIEMDEKKDIFFIDDKNQKWRCTISKYSEMKRE